MITQHAKIYDYLLSLIQQGSANDLLPSQSELCQKFDVSNITARRALGDLEKKDLIFRKKGKGSFIKKNNPSAKHIKVFLILSINITLDDDFISGIILQSQKLRINLNIYHYNHNDLELEKAIENSNPSGILWVAPDDKNSIGMAERLREKGYAVMVFGRILKNSHLNYISSDNSAGIKDICELFISHRHKRMAFIGHDEVSIFSHARYLVFQETLDKIDIKIETFAVPVLCLGYKCGDLIEPISNMIDTFRPDAILVSQGAFVNDLLSVMREKILNIPHDIEVGTYNLVSSGAPEKQYIHEIDQSIKKLGAMALTELQSIIKGKKGISKSVLEPKLLIKKNKK